MSGNKRYRTILAGLALASLAATSVYAQGETAPVKKTAVLAVDQSLPNYAVAQGVSGSIKVVGSDTMNNLFALWGEEFRRFYPSVRIEIEGKGSGTAPPALIAGTATFGPMSREMKKSEIDDFKKKFGYEPTCLSTGIDMLAVYVHKDNPIAGLAMEQLDGIFSKTRKSGSREIKTWGDLGLAGEWAGAPISVYGRNSASGTYAYFKEHALFKGDFKDTVKEQPGSSAVVQGVASDRFGIGYSGIGYRTADVKVVSLAPKAGAAFCPAEPDRAYAGEYPLARFLYVYTNRRPGHEIDTLRAEFLKFVFCQEGQADVIKAGYLPVTGFLARKELEKVGIVLQLRVVEAAGRK